MDNLNRRQFVKSAAGMAGAAGITGSNVRNLSESSPSYDATADMPLGIIIPVGDSAEKAVARVKEMGFGTCQLNVRNYSTEGAAQLRSAFIKYEVLPTSLICMGPGPYVWNFYEGPSTIGLIPRGRRAERIERLKQGTDFCARAGIPAVHTHFGFIPEDPNDSLYQEFIQIMQDLASYAKDRGIDVYFETGQETPTALLRAIEDIGYDNLGVNYDTANLILYGKANPVDGLDTLGPYVKALHAKDGFYPTNPKELGREVPIGEGKVDFPKVIRRLKELNFKGHITIEREISGPKQTEDILKSKTYLENLIKTA